jgi:hypothetical protein
VRPRRGGRNRSAAGASFLMSGSAVDTAMCVVLILPGTAIGYYTGTRRRPPRHGSVQLRKPRHRRLR